MRFIGSKAALLTWIHRFLQENLEGDKRTFCDLFAGTAVVARYFKPRYEIYSNDTLHFSYILQKATIENNLVPTFSGLREVGISDPCAFLERYAFTPDAPPFKWFTLRNYSPWKGCERQYLTCENAARADFIRETLDAWLCQGLVTELEFAYLLAGLLEGIPYVSNITGTYGAYLKNWDSRAYTPLRLHPPGVVDNRRKNRCFQQDANTLIRVLEGDILYIDPPYNARQYLPNYHLLETVSRGDCPTLTGITGIRPYDQEKSRYCSRGQVRDAFGDLIANAHFSDILISYSTEGLMHAQDIEKILKGYGDPNSFRRYDIPYRKYKSKIRSKAGNLQEYLFYIRKKTAVAVIDQADIRRPIINHRKDLSSMKTKLEQLSQTLYKKSLEACTDKEIYYLLLHLTKETEQGRPRPAGDRKLYYISAEFLIGKLLSNNLINLGIYDDVQSALAEAGKDLTRIEEAEPEPSLGNGGLGRLAACFLDSIATLGLNGDGVGLNYHYGLFRQLFADGKQKETPDPWLEPETWLTKTDVGFAVPFGGFTLHSTMYDIDVPGFGLDTVNKLHLFDLNRVDEDLVSEGISFDKNDLRHNLTLFLYPDDSDDAGRLLRVYQQYFMVSNAAQLILKETLDKGYDLRDLDKHVVIQINDTHPSMVIPELIRLLMEHQIPLDEAIAIVSKTCAYTNHTILAEALEKWPMDFLKRAAPHLVPIIRELDKRIKRKYPEEKYAIIDEDNRVHMAHMDIHYGISVNGVAALHTEILKKSELKHFYDIYPEKFNNKTNGITFRRWLMHCNPALSQFITEQIGDAWQKDASQLDKLMSFVDDKSVLEKVLDIKRQNKAALKSYLKNTQGIDIDENAIFDIQVKRLHEYKRQQMNALYAIYKYKEIKAGRLPKRPITMIFGAKAAPAYVLAKDIIHLILCLSQLINNDPEVSPYLKVVMVENYNVTKASKLIPACDISEQISLASKEASGTSNMKFMLNGAVTLGTMDGANVEIHELVGDENIYIFGKSSEEVIALYDKESYNPRELYEGEPMVEELVDFLISKELIRIGDPENLCRLYKDIVNKDWFMALADVKDYIRVKEQALSDYEDQAAWAKKMLVNTAKAGFFSSDRTIEQYNAGIWHL